MKTSILTVIASCAAVSALLAEDLEVRLMFPSEEGPSPIKVELNAALPLVIPLGKDHLELLTTADPNVTPAMRLAETRIIHDAEEAKLYKVIPSAVGLNGYQDLEFSFKRNGDGSTKFDLTWTTAGKRTTMTVAGEFESPLVVELRNPATKRSVFCSLDVGAGKNRPG